MRRSAFREALDPLARLLPRLTHYRKYVALIFTMLLLHRVCGTVLNVLGAALVSHIMLVNHVDGWTDPARVIDRRVRGVTHAARFLRALPRTARHRARCHDSESGQKTLKHRLGTPQ